MPADPSLITKLSQITVLLLDVDGVLTKGEITYTAEGTEIKTFNVKDGLGIRLFMDANLQLGIVTGRSCPALAHRCRNLGIDRIWDGVRDKTEVLPEILATFAVPADQVAYMGDDLPDIPLMKRVGVGLAVADAHPLVRASARMVTAAKGGQGAVREACEAILQAGGRWESAIQRFCP